MITTVFVITFVTAGTTPLAYRGLFVDVGMVLLVTMSILFGFIGGIGGGVGTLVVSVLNGPLALPDVLRGANYLFVGYVAACLWRSKDIRAWPGSGSRRWRYFIGATAVTAVTTSLLTAANGWIQVTTRQSTFGATVWSSVGAIPPALAITPVSVVLLYPLLRRYGLTPCRVLGTERAEVVFSRQQSVVVAALVLVWLIGGTGLSMFYYGLDIVPESVLASRGLVPLLVLADDALFGPDGVRLQVLFGAVMFGVLCSLLVRSRSDSSPWSGTDTAAFQRR